MVAKSNPTDRAILKSAVEKIKALPPMDFEAFRDAANNALRQAVAEHKTEPPSPTETQP